MKVKRMKINNIGIKLIIGLNVLKLSLVKCSKDCDKQNFTDQSFGNNCQVYILLLSHVFNSPFNTIKKSVEINPGKKCATKKL